MRRAALAALAAVALPLAAGADPAAQGRISTDEGTVEILGRPVKVGERIETPEGWLRVEEAGPEDGEVGSFSVVAVESFGAAGAPEATAPATAGAPAGRPAGAPDCTAERSAYLAELWRLSGIEDSDPVALLEGLRAGSEGADTGYYWFALATDPFRPLAWSSTLRDRAEALVRCVRGG